MRGSALMVCAAAQRRLFDIENDVGHGRKIDGMRRCACPMKDTPF
jgi:hypothetical protein